MPVCEIIASFKCVKKYVIKQIMVDFCPLPSTLEEMDGLTFGIPFGEGRQIILSLDNGKDGFKITAELYAENSNLGKFIGKSVKFYDKEDNPEKPIEECLDLIIDRIIDKTF